MPGYNPNEPRDYHGRWTDGTMPDHIQKKIEEKITSDEETDMKNKIEQAQKIGGDTRSMYMDDQGNWSPERQKLHEQIISETVAKGEVSTNTVYILGGAPANGKSSLEQTGVLGYPTNAVLVNADNIKDMIPEYKYLKGKNDVGAATFVHEESSYISKKIIDRSLAEKKDFIIDALGDSGIETVMQKSIKYSDGGRNRLVANYVSLDTEKFLQLAELRGKKTGRFVPRSVILENNKEISRLVPKLLDQNVYDEFRLWDTNISGKPRLVLTSSGGQKKIIDKDLYENFLKKAK